MAYDIDECRRSIAIDVSGLCSTVQALDPPRRPGEIWMAALDGSRAIGRSVPIEVVEMNRAPASGTQEMSADLQPRFASVVGRWDFDLAAE